MAKTWLITGTSSGFGRLMTEQLLARGDRVIATVRKPEVLASLAQERLVVERMELTDGAEVQAVVDRSFARERIDVVVSNAGYALFGAAEEASDEQIRHQLDTNLLGSIRLIRAAIPHLRTQGGGRILQVSSTGGQVAFPNFSLYHATKWGIEGFLEATAQEIAPFGIGCTILEPGASPTDFGKGLVRPRRLDVYERTPAGDVERAIAAGAFPLPLDPAKFAAAAIACGDATEAPKRLAVGSDSFTFIEKALEERLAALRAQRDAAFAGDLDRK